MLKVTPSEVSMSTIRTLGLDLPLEDGVELDGMGEEEEDEGSSVDWLIGLLTGLGVVGWRSFLARADMNDYLKGKKGGGRWESSSTVLYSWISAFLHLGMSIETCKDWICWS